MRFSTGRSATMPQTWGQLAFWEVLERLSGEDPEHNLLTRCDVPAGTGLADVGTALRLLVERHDSLHTRYRHTDHGPCQEVLSAGKLTVRTHSVGARTSREAAGEIARDLSAAAFDSGRDLPVRAALLCDGERPLSVLLVLNHMALDGWSLRIVAADLRALLTGRDPGPVGQQPVGRAAYERSPAGLAHGRRSLAFWRRHHEDIPASMIAAAWCAEGPDVAWARIDSPAIAVAARSLAARCGVTPGTAVLGGSALLLSAYRGERDALFRTIVATRFRPESRSLVGAFNQNALLRVGVTDEPFARYLRRTADAALRSYRHSEYDPRALRAEVDRVARGRGIDRVGHCFYNDARFHEGVEHAGDPDLGKADALAEAARGRLSDTVVEDFEWANTPLDANYFQYLFELGDTAVLALGAVRGFLAPRGPADFLADLERLLLRAARENPSADALRDAFR